MHRTLVLSLFSGLMFLCSSLGWQPNAQARRRGSSWLVRLGALVNAKPQKDAAFAIGTDNEYWFGGPLYLALGSRLAINGNYFGWDVEVGFLFMFETPKHLEPCLRATFMFGGRTPFQEGEVAQFQLGSAFGPGLRYRFESGRAIALEVQLEVGKYLREPKQVFFSVLPTLGFEF